MRIENAAIDVPRCEKRRTETSRKPTIPVLFSTIAISLFALPLIGLLYRAPWSSALDILSSPEARDAFAISMQTSLSATAFAIVFGVPLAWVQARVEYPGKRFVRALTTLPMVLPPVVGGVALLLAFGRRGIAGSALAEAGVHLPFTMAGAIVAQTFVAMPFLVITLEAAFRNADRRFEEAAFACGAKPLTVFRRITFPMVLPSVGAGAVLCWARALGEFGATITFAGNLQGVTQTMPLFVYVKLEGSNPDAAIVLSLVLLGISFATLVLLRDRWLTQR